MHFCSSCSHGPRAYDRSVCLVSSGGPGPPGPLVLRVRAIADSWQLASGTPNDRRRRGGGDAYHHSPPIATADLQRSLSPVTSTGSPDPSFSLHTLSRNCIACSWIAFLKSHQSLHVMEFSAEKWQDNELSFHRIQQSFRIEVVRSFTNPTPFSNLPPNL